MIYILRFSRPLGNANHKAQFYLGYCADNRVTARVTEHRKGKGAAITKFAVSQGIALELVATLPGDRSVERSLKNRKSIARIVDRAQRGTLRL